MKLRMFIVFLLLVAAEGGDTTYTEVEVSPSPPKFLHKAHNVTVIEGQEVTLMCSVSSLRGGYQLAWVHEESQSILSIDRHLYTRTPRLSLSADRHSAALTISPVLADDRGWYMCQVNTNPMTSSRSYLQVLVPPTLEEWSGSYVEVREGSAVRLTCSARAFPPALTTWRRTDAEPIFRTPFTVWATEGADLVFDFVRREHSGAYTCHVDNKATEPVSRTTHLTVTYPPVLWLGRELVGTKLGEDVTLNCSSEANPPPHHYWSAHGRNITANGEKYQLDERKMSTRSEILLTVKSVDYQDFTQYSCHALNPTGQADGNVKLYEIKDRVVARPTRRPTRPPQRTSAPGNGSYKNTQVTTSVSYLGTVGPGTVFTNNRKTHLVTNSISPSGGTRKATPANNGGAYTTSRYKPKTHHQQTGFFSNETSWFTGSKKKPSSSGGMSYTSSVWTIVDLVILGVLSLLHIFTTAGLG